MSLFTKKPSYEDVVHFVSRLSEVEYQKITRVVRIYRGAEKSVRSVLGGKLSNYQLDYEEIGEMPVTKAKATPKK